MSINKIPVTVIIPTINAEKHLPELLESIDGLFEDIFWIDTFSNDGTISFLLSHGMKVIQRPYGACGAFYHWMISELPIHTPWIFILSQDERISISLRQELLNLFSHKENILYDGYTVKWRLWFMGRPLHATPHNLRLFRSDKVSVTDVTCNEHFIVDGKICHLQGILEHKDSLTLFDWYEKQNVYSTMEAIGRLKDSQYGEEPRFWGSKLQRKCFFRQLLTNSFLGRIIMFFYYYFYFSAWRDGIDGFIWAKLRVWTQEVVYLKMKEIKRTGIFPEIPRVRHGGYDVRVMESALQREIFPSSVEEWHNNRIQEKS